MDLLFARAKTFHTAALLVVFAFVAACTQPQTRSREAVADALMQADRAYEAYNLEHGFNAATAKYMDFDQGFLIEPGQGLVRGREAILAERDLNEIPSPVRWTPQGAMGAQSDDLGLTWGEFAVDGGARGAYLTVWHRDGDGEWKIVTDVAVDDPAMAEGEP